ncbi:MAG: S-layer homology domain-containing protein [Evtepia sp.]|uniref:S-layer homology domain-containing protein n=1 Tax=Evtepia sp. TaxID=2773933 RepID=UPI002A74AF7B|nr:S-layer homology domain-containing protein [Evtepia sp.]MDY3014726.1 S-layer homology domain-containing protein [Evtepia sp.]
MLCLAMMLSVMVMGAGAAFTDQDKIVNEEAVDMCAALNIINGYEDDSYRPENNITRAETTKLIAMMLNGGRDASMALPTTPSFSDVKTSPNSKWAEKYIEYCAAAGIVCGWDGIFAPDNNVTGTEAAKMLLVSLGYDAVKEGFEGAAWAVNVNVKAGQVGLYDGLKTMDVSAPLTRDNAAQIIWNTLNAEVVKYSAAGQAIGMGYSLLNDAYNADATTAIMTDINAYSKDATVYEYTLSNGVKVTSKVDYSDDFAKNVSVVYNSKKEALNIFASKDAVVAEGILGNIDNYKALGTKTAVVINGEKFGVDNKASNITLNVVNFNQYSDAAFDSTQANAVGIWNNKVAVQYGFRAIDTMLLPMSLIRTPRFIACTARI